MGYIICAVHGGGVMEFTSPNVKEKQKKAPNVKQNIHRVEISVGDETFEFALDNDFINKHGLNIGTNILTVDNFILFLQELVPICEKCLQVVM
jgi:hypothetical protein